MSSGTSGDINLVSNGSAVVKTMSRCPVCGELADNDSRECIGLGSYVKYPSKWNKRQIDGWPMWFCDKCVGKAEEWEAAEAAWRAERELFEQRFRRFMSNELAQWEKEHPRPTLADIRGQEWKVIE